MITNFDDMGFIRNAWQCKTGPVQINKHLNESLAYQKHALFRKMSSSAQGDRFSLNGSIFCVF